METPIQFNGYYKYIIQIGWLKLDKITIAVFAQDILSKSKKDAKLLMNLLYPEPVDFIEEKFPQLCIIVGEISDDEEEEDLLGNQIKRVDLVNPN